MIRLEEATTLLKMFYRKIAMPNTKIKLLIRTCCLALCSYITSISVAQIVSDSAILYDLRMQNGNEFGHAMAIDGDLIVASGVRARATGSNFPTGVVYVIDSSTNLIVSELFPPEHKYESLFGWSVDIDGNLVVVGARDSDTRGNLAGSAYLFNGNTGDLLFELIPSISEDLDKFGTSVAISDGLIAIGSRRSLNDHGRVHLFSAFTGEELLILHSPNPSPNDIFGGAVEFHDDFLAVGSAGSDVVLENAGAVYVFSTTNFELIHTVTPSDFDLEFGRGFGVAISAHSGIMAVSAIFDHDQRSRSGAVYLYDIQSGNELRKIKSETPLEGQHFGISIHLSKDMLVVGARDNYFGHNSGIVYMMSRHSGKQLARLAPDDGRQEYYIGQSVVATDGYEVWAGAPGHREPSTNWETGAVYYFDCFGTICPADLSGDLRVNIDDVELFLNYYNTNQPEADFNGDNAFNYFDISAFLQNAYTNCL
tara:strand:- start:2359 stop:3798 length:1440 start_codon:yes stop_codon:yes gene_type:complete